jgi:glucose 1-dehydrogenase
VQELPADAQRRALRLQGKVVLVTGGSRSIGRAIALGCAAEGAAVVVNYRANEREACAVVNEVLSRGGKAVAQQGDVSRGADARAAVARAVDEFGRLDVLVNNAGVLRRTPVLEIEEEEWDYILSVDLKAPFLCAQAAARQMVQQGSGAIVNISSVNEERPGPGLAHYSSAKGGLRMLTRQLALELAPHGIRANAIAPGLVETDLNRADIADDAWREARIARTPLKMIGQPADVVGAAVFLASDESRYATGSTLFIDGGQSFA